VSGSPHDSAADSHAPPPEVPDLDLIRPIGQGGFGRVWLARNRTTGKLRAVKVIPLHRSGSTDPAGREITSITRLEENLHAQHPNLLVIYHVGKTAEHLFYVMDPADDAGGGAASAEATYRPATLQSRLQDGPPSARQCLRYARQLLGGLASLHAAGMVHRDVKPANCLFVGGELKLADFGLLTDADPLVSRIGTARYMPPDGRMDARADVYAAGLVIYEMLTGLPAESFPQLGRRAPELAEDPILGALNRLVLRACQGDPQRRFSNAREMLDALDASERETTAGRPRIGRRIVGAGVACLLVLAAVAAVALWRPKAPPAVQQRVNVNFITDPFEATIFLDGQQQFYPDKTPYTTPCTVENLPARPHRVVLKHPEHADVEADRIDFAEVREVVVDFRSPP